MRRMDASSHFWRFETTPRMDRRRSAYVLLVSSVAALGGLLFGYDTAVISGAIGFLRSHFSLDAAETGWAAASLLIGCMIGAGVAGVVSDAFGRKRALMASAVLFAGSALWSALPRGLTEFVIARVLGGVGVGMASLLSPLYIAEIAPARSRGRLVSLNQLAIVLGILLVYFVNYWIAGLGTEAWNVDVGWRWMVGSEGFPAIVFFFLLLLVPESPRWLVKQGRTDRALAVLSRVSESGQPAKELAEIQNAVSHEGSSLRQLFRPGMRKALVIGIVLAVLQQVTGINVFMYYAPEIFKQVGSGTNAALLQTVIIGLFNVSFTLVAMRTVDRVGRKKLMMIGIAGMGVSLSAISLAALWNKTELWLLVFILGYIASFAMSIGPIVWVVISEIFPTRIRGRAMAISTVALWAADYLVSLTFPIINENTWLVEHFNHAFPFWIYASLCVVMFVFVWRSVPETKGKTLEEIEKLWMAG